MRTGIYLSVELAPGEAPDARYETLLAHAALADELGVDGILVEEAHGDPARPAPSPQTFLSALAAVTKVARLGPAGKVLPLDHPIRVAEDFAVVDLQSNGRLLFCVGAGDCPETFRAYGVPFEERWARFEEALDLVRHAWTADAFSYGGHFYRFPVDAGLGSDGPFSPAPPPTPYTVPWKRAGQKAHGLPVLPKPIQSPHPPIWIQGADEQAAAFAARHGFAFLPPALVSTRRAEALLSAYRRSLGEAGRDPREVEVPLIRQVFVVEDQEAARRAEQAFKALYVRAASDGRLARSEGRPVGEETLDWRQLRAEHVILGGVEEVASELRSLGARLGIRWVFCQMAVSGLSPEDVAASLRLFEGEVWSRLQG